MNIKATIKEFALASRAVENNTTLLIESHKNTDLCVARMDRLHLAEEALEDIEEESDLPQPALDYFAADADKGCDRCWLSSRRSSQHGNCIKKIDRWFAARETLIRFGEQL